MFTPGQIVHGVRTGTFIVLAIRVIEDEVYLQLKSVNPANHAQMARGELTLPATAAR